MLAILMEVTIVEPTEDDTVDDTVRDIEVAAFMLVTVN